MGCCLNPSLAGTTSPILTSTPTSNGGGRVLILLLLEPLLRFNQKLF